MCRGARGIEYPCSYSIKLGHFENYLCFLSQRQVVPFPELLLHVCQDRARFLPPRLEAHDKLRIVRIFVRIEVFGNIKLLKRQVQRRVVDGHGRQCGHEESEVCRL